MPKLRNRQQKLSDLLRVILRMFSLKRKNISSACTSGEKVCHRWYEDLECYVIIGDVSCVFVYDKKSLKKKMIEIRCECRGKLTLCTPVLFHPNHERFKSFFLLCCPVSWQDKTHAKTRWRSVRKHICKNSAKFLFFLFGQRIGF